MIFLSKSSNTGIQESRCELGNKTILKPNDYQKILDVEQQETLLEISI